MQTIQILLTHPNVQGFWQHELQINGQILNVLTFETRDFNVFCKFIWLLLLPFLEHFSLCPIQCYNEQLLEQLLTLDLSLLLYSLESETNSPCFTIQPLDDNEPLNSVFNISKFLWEESAINLAMKVFCYYRMNILIFIKKLITMDFTSQIQYSRPIKRLAAPSYFFY